MITAVPRGLSLGGESVEALGLEVGAPELRKRAWSEYNRRPWPSKESEAWRRTDISGIDFARFQVLAGVSEPSDKVPAAFADTLIENEAALLWGDQGLHRYGKPQETGVVVLDLADALRQRPDLVTPHLGSCLEPERGKFDAFSAAFWTHGLFVHIPKNVDVSAIIRGGYGVSLADNQATVMRTLIVAEAGSRVTIIEDFASAPAPEGSGGGDDSARRLSIGGVEIIAAENAEVKYVNLQRHDQGVNHFLCQNARLAANARLSMMVVGLGGALTKADFGSELLAEGAVSRLYGLVFGDKDQRFTHHTWQEHRAPRTTSDLLFKAALRDTARSIYTGLIKIEKEAGKSEAYQASKNILLSQGARANAIPMLEILTDDVKCGHGAAVGSLEEDQKFYLMARGIGLSEAERVIVEGFFEEVLQRMPVPGLPDRLRAAIDDKLTGGSRG